MDTHDAVAHRLQPLSENLHRYLDTCNVYILRDGDEAVLVDFGAGEVLDQLANIGVRHVTDVLMTHHHRDQGQGLARAAAAGARIWAPHTEQDLFANVDVHWQAREIYRSYNVRQDRFSLLEPVAIAGTLQDYATRRFGGYDMMILPTPGHTPGSISLLTQVDGRSVAFTGDLMAGPGQLWSLAATQWTYNGGEGLPHTVLSVLNLRDRPLDLMLPSHGEPIAEVAPAVDLLVGRLRDLMHLRQQNPRLFSLREQPYIAVTPHLLFNRTSMANSYVLLSESGKALMIDFGFDFMAGEAAGYDRASRRPWLYTLPMLKRDFGVTTVDVALPTHYHDDHVAGMNLLRAVEGTQVWAAETFAEILERPADYDLPCLWYDPIPVDRWLRAGEPFRWEEFTITLHPLPGHTLYAVAIAFDVDGVRVLATGDQYQGDSGAELNYVYQNRYRIDDYRTSAALYRKLRPDLIISGHWAPLWTTPEYFDQIVERDAQVERLQRELLHPDVIGLDAEGFAARLSPYQVDARAGEPVEFVAEVRNPFDRRVTADVCVVAPDGWGCLPRVLLWTGPGCHPELVEGCHPKLVEGCHPELVEGANLLGPHETRAMRFRVTPPAGLTVRRARVAVDLAFDGRRFGQQAEALVNVLPSSVVTRPGREPQMAP